MAAFIAPFKTSEVELSRQLYEDLEPLDVALADQAYGTYVDLVQLIIEGGRKYWEYRSVG